MCSMYAPPFKLLHNQPPQCLCSVPSPLNLSHSHSDAENSRSACFDWLNFIRTGIKFEILVHILLFGPALLVKFMILTCLFKKISASLRLVPPFSHVERLRIPSRLNLAYYQRHPLPIFLGSSHPTVSHRQVVYIGLQFIPVPCVPHQRRTHRIGSYIYSNKALDLHKFFRN